MTGGRRDRSIVNDLRGRLCGPRHDTQRRRVGLEHDVDLGRADRAVVVRILARDGLQEDALGHAHALVFRKLVAGMTLPRAMPAMSGTTASTSEMP